MHEPGESPLSVAGSFLVASPALLDPNFRRTVVFVASNDPDHGSFGLIMNRFTGRRVADLLPDRELGELGRTSVFIGGPVAQDQLTFATFRWKPAEREVECRHQIAIEEAEEIARTDFSALRAFVGYSGWGQGQLEMELAQNGWLLASPVRDFLDAKRPTAIWKGFVRKLGPKYKLLAEAPDDPSLN